MDSSQKHISRSGHPAELPHNNLKEATCMQQPFGKLIFKKSLLKDQLIAGR